MAPTKRRLLKLASLVLVIVAVAYGVIVSLRVALGTEYPVVVVNGVSMNPTYSEGDLLVVQGIPDTSCIAVHDIIVFHDPSSWDTLIVHRVVDVHAFNDQWIFWTQGDNNDYADPWQIREEHLVGRVLQKIPYVGGVITAIRSPYGMGIIFSSIIVLIVVEVVSSVTGTEDGGRASKRGEALTVLGGMSLRLLGVVGAVFAWVVIYLAIQRNPWFAVTEHAFSDLGGPMADDPGVFNTGLMVLSGLFSLYALTLIQDARNKVETVGGAFALLAGLFLTLIGVYPSGTDPHTFVSIWFFIQADIAITAWGLGILWSGWRRLGAAFIGIGVVGPLIAVAIPWPSIAVVEVYGIVLIDVWVALMLRIQYVRLKRAPATYLRFTPR
jgi:signal peptidase I